MPTYELTLLLKMMPRSQVVSSLKRISTQILDADGAIRSIENMGEKVLPYRIGAHGEVHSKAHAFLIKYDCPPLASLELLKEYSLDVDIVRRRVYTVTKPLDQTECTLEEELQPPAYRKEVKEWMAIEKQAKERSRTHKYKYNSGLDYFPFQR